MDPITIMSLASFGLSLADRLFAPKPPKPYGPWLEMQDKIIEGIKRGLEAGGYTFSDDVANRLIRKGLEDIGARYEGAARRVKEQIVPYGNIGAAGRKLEGIEAERARAESAIGTDIRTLQEQTKLRSYENLLNLGRSIPDPMLNYELMRYQTPTTGQAFVGAAEQGLSTFLNLSQAQRDKLFWQNMMGNPNIIGNRPLLPGPSTPSRRYTLGKAREFEQNTMPLIRR